MRLINQQLEICEPEQSSAVKQINMNLISMYRYMKDVALAKNEEQFEVAIYKVNEQLF